MRLLQVVGMIGIAETGWLLKRVIAQIRRFVVMSDDRVLAVGLWVLHTWAVEASDCAPYLDVSSPSRECGKTRLIARGSTRRRNDERAPADRDPAASGDREGLRPLARSRLFMRLVPEVRLAVQGHRHVRAALGTRA
jgi:hypothetical protein